MNDDGVLDHLIEDLFLATEQGDDGVLARLVAAHPEYEHQLTAYAVAGAGLSAPLSPAEREAARALATPQLRNRALNAAFGHAADEQAYGIRGILAQARLAGLDARQLATAVDLPRDVLLKLDRRLIVAASVPQRCLRRLAEALNTSSVALQSFLAGGPAERIAAFNYAPAPPVAEQQETFASALAASTLATSDQRAAWQGVLQDEGLA